MQTITVKRLIKAPIAQVFDVLSHHEGYTALPGMQVARLERAGHTERNGEGAVRYLKSGPAWFREEITVFERPRRMDYVILESLLPLQHKGASLRLTETAEGTQVTWTSTFRIKVPLLGGTLSRLLAKKMAQGFGGALKQMERRLTSGS
jgi:uncharacterized protein YndB with AHSA1/START domain